MSGPDNEQICLSLPELERELVTLLLEREEQTAAWPKPPRAIDRYAIGKRIEQIDQRIGELYREIAVAEAHTIADVAAGTKARSSTACAARCLSGAGVVSPQCRCGQELVDSALVAG